MAFGASTVALVRDKLDEIQDLLIKVREPVLKVSNDGRSQLALTDSERDALRIRMNGRIATLRSEIRTEVLTDW
jgi:hypothetical protein